MSLHPPTGKWTSRSLAGPFSDLFAGLAVAGVLLPEAVAYAAIAQVPTTHALLAALVGLCVYPLLGSSRFAIVAPTSSAAAVFGSAVVSGGPQMGVALVFLTGGLFLLSGLLRAEFLGAFISRPVLRGFAWALAVTIVLKQVPHVLGVHVSATNIIPVLDQLAAEASHLHRPSLWWGAGALALWLLLHHALRRWIWLPPSLVVLALGVALSAALQPAAQGMQLVGRIEWQALGLRLPDLSLEFWQQAAEIAPALLLVLFAESWSSVRSLALQQGDEVDARRELLALGAANSVSALLQGLPVGAGFSAAAANQGAGARSKWAGVAAALALALLLWLARPALALLPVPVVAAVVMAILLHNLWPHSVLGSLRLRNDTWLALVAAAGVIGFGVLFGMLLAVGLSLALALKRFAEPVVVELGRLPGTRDFVNAARHPDAQILPGVLIMRPDEPLFFANAEAVFKRVADSVRREKAHTVILSLEMSDDLDSTALEAMGELCKRLSEEKCQLMLARIKDPARQGLERSGLRSDGRPGVRLFWSVDDAVSAAESQPLPQPQSPSPPSPLPPSVPGAAPSD